MRSSSCLRCLFLRMLTVSFVLTAVALPVGRAESLRIGAPRGQGATIPSPAYGIVDLGVGALGYGSAGRGINERGQVVGVSVNAEGRPHATLWDEGREIDLGTLGGSDSQPVDINRMGHVVGIADTPTGEHHAVLWRDGITVELDALGRATSLPYDVNNRDEIAGVVGTVMDEPRAVVWRNGEVEDLGIAGRALRINDQGLVLVHAIPSQALLWQRGAATDLGTLGGLEATPYDMNNHGHVVGSSVTASGDTHAFLWRNGVMTDLGTLGGASYAYHINDRDMVIGASVVATGGEHGFVWVDGRMIDLGPVALTGINDRGVVIGSDGNGAFTWDAGAMVELGTLGGGAWVSDINDHGEIVGYSYTGTGEAHACLWTKRPITSASTLVSAEPVRSAAVGLRVVGASQAGRIPIEFEVQSAGGHGYRVTVFDVQGRKVRAWEGSAGRGSRDSWDGRAADGSRVASGLYLLRVEVPGKTLIHKVVLAR